jgi:hypothetical protein
MMKVRLGQFASQTEHLIDDVLRELRKVFSRNQSMEFYEGLLAGFASSYVIAQ